jgi:transposase
VDEVLDLGPVLADYTDKRGYRPYDPRLMLRLLVYGYTAGLRSSRAIERSCAGDIAFRYLAADQAPDFRSISRFRRRRLNALTDLFTQSLHRAEKLGMVKMGRVALNGTKLEANASKHQAHIGSDLRRYRSADEPACTPGTVRDYLPHRSGPGQSGYPLRAAPAGSNRGRIR